MSSPARRKLNLGCGLDYRTGYLNVDLHQDAVADQVAAALELELQPGQLTEILLNDIIEHLGYCGFSRLLWRARRWLEAGGELVIETPDLDACVAAYVDAGGPAEREDVLCHLYGIEDPGMSHLFCYPAELLRTMLEESGFEVVLLERFAERPQRPSLRCRARKLVSAHADERCALLDAIASSDQLTIRYADFPYFVRMVRATLDVADAPAYLELLHTHAVTSARLCATLHTRLRDRLAPLLGEVEHTSLQQRLDRQAGLELFALLAERVVGGAVRSFADAEAEVRRLHDGELPAAPDAKWRVRFNSDFFTRESFARFVSHLRAHATRRGDERALCALREVAAAC